MARRPTVPRPTSRSTPRPRAVPPRRQSPPSRQSLTEPPRTAARTVAPVERAAAPEDQVRQARVVEASGRFRDAFRARPWLRRRRRIAAGVAVVILVLLGALAALAWLPALRLHQVTVEGLGYVSESEISEIAHPHVDESLLLLPTGALAEQVEQVPGVASAEVERSFPDEVVITVTERKPLASLTRPDGSTAILDAAGTELPAAAGEGAQLVPLSVDGGSADPHGAAETMIEVLAALPEDLRAGVVEVSAASRSDVTLELSLPDPQDEEATIAKTVVWGDAADAELKSEVVKALIPQPGTVIDVSSPVAPVTR